MPDTLKVKVGQRWYTVEVGDIDASPVRVLVDGEPVEVDIRRPAAPQASDSALPDPTPDVLGDAEEPSDVLPPRVRTPAPVKEYRSPMGGVIVSVAIKKGDQIVTGDEVCVLEAMKMQQSLASDWSGIVQAVHMSSGQQVKEGDLLLELE